MDNITSKTFTSIQGNWVGRKSITASRVWIHGSSRMQECWDESEIYNYQRIQLSNNKFISGILGGTLDLAWLKRVTVLGGLNLEKM